MSKIQGLLKAFQTVSKDLKLMKNTDRSVKIYYFRIARRDNGDISTVK